MTLEEFAAKVIRPMCEARIRADRRKLAAEFRRLRRVDRRLAWAFYRHLKGDPGISKYDVDAASAIMWPFLTFPRDYLR